jgi:hypothetical protein
MLPSLRQAQEGYEARREWNAACVGLNDYAGGDGAE